MLLDEHGGQDDQYYEYDDESLHSRTRIPLLQPGGGNAQGVSHMQGRTDPGVGVEAVKKANRMGQEILPRENLRPQQLYAGPADVDCHGHSLGHHDVDGQAAKAVNIIESEPHQTEYDEQIPAEIGNQKPLAEWNQVVQSAVYHMTGLRRNQIFCEKEQGKIDYPAGQQFQMGKLRFAEPGQAEAAVINHRFFHTEFHAPIH